MHVGKRVGVSLFTIILYLLLEALYEWLGLSTVPANILAVGSALLCALLFLFGPSALRWLRSRLRLRAKRRRTYGREFLLLLERDTRKACLREWTSLPQSSRVIRYILVGVLIFLSFRCISDYYNGPISSDNILFGCFLLGFCWIIVPYEACCFLSEILLPIYRARRQAKAQAERDVITQRIEAKLPQARYRVSGSTITSIEQFRSMASERRLPEELVPDAADLERANLELMEAEADMPAQPQAKAQTT